MISRRNNSGFRIHAKITYLLSHSPVAGLLCFHTTTEPNQIWTRQRPSFSGGLGSVVQTALMPAQINQTEQTNAPESVWTKPNKLGVKAPLVVSSHADGFAFIFPGFEMSICEISASIQILFGLFIYVYYMFIRSMEFISVAQNIGKLHLK